MREQIIQMVKNYYEISHKKKEFIPGKSFVHTNARVFDQDEIQMLTSASLDFWLTAGRFNHEFEKKLGEFLDVKFVTTTNSGSSANLLALSTLTSEKLEDRALKTGDEVISVAASFVTTVNPIIQNNLVPVFVDIEIPSYNINTKLIENAITEKTKAIMIAHSLGNPFDVDEIIRIAKKYNLWVVEDCCDALGAKYDGKMVGTFGDVSSLSFFPAHHITMGEGGAVFTNNPLLNRIIRSIRDWGRDCYCDVGQSNTCGKRFEWNFEGLPEGYDHKFVYTHTGYNLKITDMQAAIGLAQLKKVKNFIQKRRDHFRWLKNHLKEFEKYFILPEETSKSEPSWFGFPLTIKNNAPFSLNEINGYLISHNVDTRPIFSGNITLQPYFKNKNFRIVGELQNTNKVMTHTFWIGVYPGLTIEMMEYVVKTIRDFIQFIETQKS
ncbi:lipopolysaccharide biosynthesis protein RfbH [Nitrosopumilus sp. b2]|nr:lipopolysaccharide biosynthesis protein RfbH [Nitrosopumilus sp. b2]